MTNAFSADSDDLRSEDVLTRVKGFFEEARQTLETARQQSETDLDYYHGAQWTAAEVSELRKRRQPVVTYNLVRSKIESICGVEEGTMTSPKAWPRTPADEDAAEVATDTLRYVCDVNRFDKVRVDVLRDMLVGGTGGVIVEIDAANAEQRPEIKIRRLRWETLVYDPFSRETDFSDARYVGGAIWMNEADVIALYGEEARSATEGALHEAGFSIAGAGDSYSDRPNWTWADPKRRRVLVVELYYCEGREWRHTVFTGSGLIRDGASSYLDADGMPSCPIELVSAYVNRDNERYGAVRDMRSPQDEVNHRRSKLLHLLNTRQTFRKEGTISSKDPQALRRELNKPDGDVVIAKNATWGQDVGIIDTAAQLSGQSELLAEAKEFLDRLGPNSSLVGRETETQSGRAILAQQQGGLSELATLYSAHNDWVLRVYRQIWARARQFWTAPMYVRVTDDLQSPKFVQINEPVLDATGQPVIDWATGQPQLRNRLVDMGVDLVVDRAPLAVNLQAEEFQTLAKLAQGGVPIPPQTLVMASNLRNKQALLDSLKPPPPPPPQPPIPPDPALQRLAAAEAGKLEAETMERMARAEKIAVETRRVMAMG